jgi:uncharacterized protein (DUF4213/DUF364 family)
MPQAQFIDDILQTLPDGEVQSVTVGKNWTAVVVEVEGQLRAGLSTSFWHQETSSDLGEIQNLSALELANLVRQPLSYQTGIGAAAVNALLPRQPDAWREMNAEKVIVEYGAGKRVAMVGHFPFTAQLRDRVGHLDVLEKQPRPGDLPAEAAPEVVPYADVLAITGTTLLNGTFSELLALSSPSAKMIVLGPSTFLSPVLFDYGVHILCGSIVEYIPQVVDAVRDAKRYSQVHHAGVRLVAIHRMTD